jgi:hypothetical protein
MKGHYFAALILSLTSCLAPSAQTSDGPKKVDEFGNICCAEMKVRLDDFAGRVLKEPKARAYIIFYGGRRQGSCDKSRLSPPRRGEAQARAERMVAYLHDAYDAIDGFPVVLVDGGYREQWSAELWVAPNWDKPPKPTPTLGAKAIRYRSGKLPGGEYECMRYARRRAT